VNLYFTERHNHFAKTTFGPLDLKPEGRDKAARSRFLTSCAPVLKFPNRLANPLVKPARDAVKPGQALSHKSSRGQTKWILAAGKERRRAVL
jgi:hypothetical protein